MIRIGTASWADPEFVRDWYPAKLPAAKRLPWYAEHLNYVEVNSSFYAIPAAKSVRGWAENTPEGFLFDVKLHRLFSHHMARSDTLPKDLRPLASVNPRGNVIPTPELILAMAERTCEELHPLRAAGKLGVLLLQLSPSFSPHKAQLESLDTLLGAFPSFKVAVELRNRNWMEEGQKAKTVRFFTSRKIPMVLVDTPESGHFTVMPALNIITDPETAYLRLHGRDEEFYLTGKTVAERFNYLYSEDELQGIAERVKGLAARAGEVRVAFNNNHSDYAPKAAMRLREILQA
ncbi:MAG: hypothetical protein JWM59_3569 [Verrucomicrobiales bacterium]|nr:hypothetical protein [Verrucomicrobiales bacterium]